MSIPGPIPQHSRHAKQPTMPKGQAKHRRTSVSLSSSVKLLLFRSRCDETSDLESDVESDVELLSFADFEREDGGDIALRSSATSVLNHHPKQPKAVGNSAERDSTSSTADPTPTAASGDPKQDSKALTTSYSKTQKKINHEKMRSKEKKKRKHQEMRSALRTAPLRIQPPTIEPLRNVQLSKNHASIAVASSHPTNFSIGNLPKTQGGYEALKMAKKPAHSINELVEGGFTVVEWDGRCVFPS